MKENIELLERRMRYSEKQFEYEGEYAYLGDEEIQAIENLIKAYKELEENSISKDKIREKIEELEKNLQDFEQTDNTGRFIRTKSRDYDKKKALEELLEE